jgi:hypothetical protein
MHRRFVIAALVMAACGGDGKPQIGANKDNVCSQIASVTCYNLYQCCSEGQIESFLRVSDPRSEEDCITDVTRLCDQETGLIDASIKAGRATFDATAMNACLKALVAPDSCTSVGAMLPWAAACMKSAWTGAVPVGSACMQGFECADLTASYCAPNQRCTVLPADGMPCVAGNGTMECAAGFFCNIGTCRPQLAAGGMCASNQQCQKGNFCNTAQPRVCEALHATGQACSGNLSCQSGKCLPGVCSAGAGSCFTNTDCQFNNRCSNNGAFCTTDASCGTGTCSVGGALCTSAAGCTGAGNTCVFPNTCILSTCSGNPVCADAQVSVDYCTDAVAARPTPP